MFNRKIGWRAALVAGAAVMVVVTSLNPTVAFADTTQPSLIKYRTSSDPHVEGCATFDPVTGAQHDFWCMYASSDLNQTPDPFYPMSTTYVYTFDPLSGLNPGDPNSWVDRSNSGTQPAFYQGWMPYFPGNTQNHLWAPTAHYGLANQETLLYVPDIYGSLVIPGISGDDQVSYIAVASSNSGGIVRGANPWGPFTYQKAITYKGDTIRDSYMSDPAVVTLAGTHPVVDGAGGPATWLLWANGDNGGSPCGDLSIGMLNDNDLTDLVDNPSRKAKTLPDGTVLPGSEIHIDGIGAALGTCSGSDQPYVEGPELYDLTQVHVELPTNPTTNQSEPYALFFAAKPTGNGGTHGPGNQVLAWASASTPKGPYTYRGILMDSSDTSWTNHGSILARTNPNISPSQAQFIMFFHDEQARSDGNRNATPPIPPDPHHRMVRAVCLQYSTAGKGFVTAARPTAIPDLNSCTSIVA